MRSSSTNVNNRDRLQPMDQIAIFCMRKCLKNQKPKTKKMDFRVAAVFRVSPDYEFACVSDIHFRENVL